MIIGQKGKRWSHMSFFTKLCCLHCCHFTMSVLFFSEFRIFKLKSVLIKTRTPMGNGTFRDILLHTKSIFLSCTSLSCERRFYDSRFWFHCSETHLWCTNHIFRNFPFTFGVTSFCSELECVLVFAFFSSHAMYFGQWSIFVSCFAWMECGYLMF